MFVQILHSYKKRDCEKTIREDYSLRYSFSLKRRTVRDFGENLSKRNFASIYRFIHTQQVS